MVFVCLFFLFDTLRGRRAVSFEECILRTCIVSIVLYLWVDFDVVFTIFSEGSAFQSHYMVLIFVTNSEKWRSKIAESPKIGGKVCTHHIAEV